VFFRIKPADSYRYFFSSRQNSQGSLFQSRFANRRQKRKSLSVADSSPHGRVVQARSATRHDRETEEPEM
jgi:hypothetical protein